MRAILRTALLALAFAGAAPATAAPPSRYTTAETDIGTLLADPAAKAVIARYVPDFASDPRTGLASAMTLRQVAPMFPSKISAETLDRIDADLARLPAKK